MRKLAFLVAVVAVFSLPATAADAAKRPGTPKPSVVLRAISGVAKTTPFASGRTAARSARRAFARKQFCPASNALARHHTQVVRRIKVAKRRRARGTVRRLTRLDGRSIKARALVLRSLPVGKACGGPPAVAVDGSIKPQSKRLPPIGGSGPRPLARVVDAYGEGIDFVANELIVSGSDAAVRALVRRWNGKILATADLTRAGGKRKQFLVRINASKADETRLSSDLDALAKASGAASVSSDLGLDLLAAAGRETRRGSTVGVNYVNQGSAIGSAIAREAPEGPNGFATTGPGWDSNAFNWKHMSATSTQGVGTAQAWQLLARSGRSANRVGLAVLDMGFAPVTNGPDFGAPLTAISNVPFTSALGTSNISNCGSPCPWHGTSVANTAFAVPDNNLGVAGTGGLVANRIVIFTLYDFFTSITAVIEARVAGARVLNMSYGAGVPAILSWSVIPFEIATAAVHTTGMTLMAAAGNDSTNVDDTDCFIVCWEETLWTPCENVGVFCVGALGHDTVNRAGYSNYGKSGGGVDLFAPGTVLVGRDPSTPGVQQTQGTSSASPYLAGVAALVRAADPGLSANDLERILKETAKTSSDGNVRKYVDALAAVKRALPRLVKIDVPVSGSSIDKGAPVQFSAFVYDDDLGAPASITWTRTGGAVIGTGASFSTTALPYGTTDVQVRVVFPDGFAVTDQVRITITNTPPTVRISQPSNGSSFYQNETVPLSGTSSDINQPDSYRLRDEQVSWFRDGSATPFATGHSVTLNLTGVSVGSHTITMRGTDDAGATASESITINVAPASANPPPTVSITSPTDGASQYACCQEPHPDNRWYAIFNFQANASDPNGDPLTYTWTETLLPGGTPQVRSTVQDPENQKVYWGGCAEQGHDWRLSVSDGTSTRSAVVRVHVSVLC